MCIICCTAPRHAGTWGETQRNVAALVKPPKGDSEEVVILTSEQVSDLMRHVEGPHCAESLRWRLPRARRGELRPCASRTSIPTPALSALSDPSTDESGPAVEAAQDPQREKNRQHSTLHTTELRAHIVTLQERRLALGMGRASRDDLLSRDGMVKCGHRTG